MSYSVAPLEELIDSFERLPGIGRKTAARLAMFVISDHTGYAESFSNALLNAKKSITYCSCCQNITDTDVCALCTDETRDKSTICVVESPQDVMAFERMREYHGMYHVLHGVLSPLDGMGPEQIKLKELMLRLSNEDVSEVIVATNPTVEGEATASYISRLIKPMGIKTTRLAYGIPVGGDLEYADEVTLSRALEGRNEI